MSKKRLRVVLEIDVADLTDEQRREHAQLSGIEESEIPCLDEYSPDEIAEVVAGIRLESVSEELFSGSDMFARFTDAKVIEAKWVARALSQGRA